jgi:hypothetical protein
MKLPYSPEYHSGKPKVWRCGLKDGIIREDRMGAESQGDAVSVLRT